MNEEIKRRWVEALRSGEFRQGAGNLSRDDKYCCLGVLCEIAVRDGVIGSKYHSLLVGAKSYGKDSNWEVNYLPFAVQEWAGIPGSNPLATISGQYNYLASFNDEGFTFDQIADGIEASL